MNSGSNSGGVAEGERADFDGDLTIDGRSEIKMDQLDQKKEANAEGLGPDLGRPVFASMNESPTCQVGHYIFLRC